VLGFLDIILELGVSTLDTQGDVELVHLLGHLANPFYVIDEFQFLFEHLLVSYKETF
jgi:hypothetical protein